ncbi:MAG: hypothetical protein AB8G22_23575 [Saprospiraceae bacterium]
MQQSRLVKYILGMSSREQDLFQQFIHSPYFNQHEKTTHLLDYILKAKSKNLTKEQVYKKLFPRKPYDEQILYNTMSYLMKLYHRFLAFQYFEKQPFREQLYTIEAAYQNRQFDLFKNRANQLEKSLDKYHIKDSQTYFVRYRLNYLQGMYKTENHNRANTTHFQVMLDNFDKYYLAEKLHHSCNLTGQMLVMNTEYNLYFLEDLMTYLQKNWTAYQKEPAIAGFYTILKMLRDTESDEHYLKLKSMLTETIGQLSPEAANELYTFAFNYCIRQIGAGENQYQSELFQLYQQGLSTGALLINDVLTEWDYKNITTLGSALKEFVWTEQFLEQYKDKLPEKQRENAYNYNLARFYFSQQLYNETLSLLLHVQFTEPQYHLGATDLLVRSYFALKNYEALLSLLETFRIYVIRNKKITTIDKKGYTNYCRFTKRVVLLISSRITYTRKTYQEKIKTLKEKIGQTSNIKYKQWLVRICEQETGVVKV